MKRFSLVLLVIMTLVLSVWTMADEPAKWTPQYDSKGELLNPEPSISLFRQTDTQEFPVTTTETVELFEDFNNWGPYGDNPPSGWTIIDSASTWDNNDWYFYNHYSWGDIARTNYSPRENLNEWIVSPGADFTGATACSLTFYCYYNDYTGDDTLQILYSTNGTDWSVYESWAGVDSGSTTKTSAFFARDITGIADEQASFQVAFRWVGPNSTSFYGYVYLDDVLLQKDAIDSLVYEDFSGWGPYGDNPPTGWTIIDYGDYAPTWDNNDWHKYYNSSWADTIARVYYSPIESQNEWLISPAIDLDTTSYDQIMLRFNQFYDDYSGDLDTGFVYVYDGSAWNAVDTLVGQDYGSSSTPDFYEKDITSWANGNSGVQVAFKYVGNNAFYCWNVDSVVVAGIELAADDVATTAINSPTLAIDGYGSWGVQTTVFNNGTATATFDDSVFIERIQKTQHFFYDFNDEWGPLGDNPPTGWTIIDNGDGADGWNNNDWHRYSYWSGYVAAVRYSPVENQEEWLITPAVNLSGVSENIYMSFKAYYNDYTGDEDTAYVLGSADDFTTIDTLAAWTSDHLTETNVWDVTSWAANQSNVKFAFTYVSYNQGNWYVDDVEVFSIAYPAAEYVQGVSVTGLPSLTDTLITFSPDWTPSGPDDYIVTSFTAMATDADNSNDTLVNQITCYPHFGSGGPDDGYYIWEDNINGSGDAYSWIDITSIGDTLDFDLGSGDDRYTSAFDMGISFFFYGTTYDSVYIHENGLLAFDEYTLSTYFNYGIPSSSGLENMIAMFWDDLSGVDNGTAFYYTNNVDTFIVTFENWDFYADTDQRIDMQAILCSSTNTIKLQYQTIGPVIYVSHTIGIENADYSAGLQYVYNDDPLGNIAWPGLAITFSYSPPPIDGAMTSIDVPVDGGLVYLGDTVTPTVTISALGEDSLQAQVTFKIFDEYATEVYNQTESSAWVPALGSIQHAFATDFTPAAEGTFDVEAFIVVTNDINVNNDSLTSSFDVAQHYSSGGPDDYGYRFIDNVNGGVILDPPPAPTFSYVDISATATDTLVTGDDVYDGPFGIGFPFSYYGTSYDSFYVSTNGFISFGSPGSSHNGNDCPLPNTGTPNVPLIGLFWDDLNVRTSDGGAVLGQYFDAEVDYYVVQYYNVSRYSYYGDPMDFELILYADGNILMQYLSTNDLNYGHGQSATVGLEDDAIPSGLVYECNGDPFGNQLVDNLAILFYYYEPAINAIMESIDNPTFGLVGEETFPAVTVKNDGQSATTMDVNFTITDDGDVEVYNQTESTVSIDPGVSHQHVFTTGWTPSAAGDYTTAATVTLTGDEFPDDNDAAGTCGVWDAFTDLEADDGGFSGTGDWEWGIPLGGYPESAHSGENCWGTLLSGDAPTPNTTSNLDFYVDVGTDASVNYYQWIDGKTTSPPYVFNIFVDEDTIASWSPGTENEWVLYSIDLSTYSGIVRVRLQLVTETTYSFYEGWYVDDFGFLGCAPVPAVSIYDIQYAADLGGGCYDSPYDGEIIQTNGVVTAIMQGSYPNYFVQDCADEDWNGVYVYDNTQDSMEIGDDVTFIAEVDEYYGLTELKNVVGLVTNSSGNTLCTLSVSSDDVGTECDTLTAVGENLEGMLVILENALCVVGPDSYNVSWVKTPGATDSCAVDDDLYRYGGDQPDAFVEGETYNIVGLVHYAYDIYKVLPRFAADVTEATAEIFGTVTDAGASPLLGVEVNLYDADDTLEVVIASDTTDASGEFSFVLGDFGTFNLEFLLDGYYDAAEFNIVLNAGDAIQVDIVMHVPATYGGTVTDEDTVALENVHVWVESQIMAMASSLPTFQTMTPIQPITSVERNSLDIMAEKTAEAKPVGHDAQPLADAEYCEMIMTGDPAWAISGWFTGGEAYAIYQAPDSCGLTPTYPFNVTSLKFSMMLSGTSPSPEWLWYQYMILDADLSRPCPKPGENVLYASDVDSTLFSPGNHYWINHNVDVLVSGPYFLVVVFPYTESSYFRLITEDNIPPDTCLVYNDWGSGWEDLADYFGSFGILSSLWRSDGYTTDVLGIVEEDWTDVNGDYELVLHPGVYNIHYALDGYDSVTVESVVCEYDQVTTDADVQMVASGYAYYPGDANMINGLWPPQVIGADVTFLVNYFRGTATACELDGFYASGDANGDCLVIGSDVTRLVTYFRGLAEIEWCGNDETDPDSYPPLWLTEEDFPETAPDGWPNCDPPPPVTSTTIPTGSVD